MAIIKKYKWIIVFLIILCIFASAWYVISNNLIFHTDIARDFLVMEKMVRTRRPTLIGPRSGGVAGVFHGPLWFYLNLPAFIIGGGNPIVVGWFWIILSATAIFSTYYFGKKLFSQEVALLATLGWSIFSISLADQMANPFGAIILFPAFFYFFSCYLKKIQVKYLLTALFCLGLIIQFQIAFGGPILILTTIYLIPFLKKRKKLLHFFCLLILLIPFATYLLFELRHNFLQVRSVLSYLHTKQKEDLNILSIIFFRLKGFLLDGLNITALKNSLFALPITLLFCLLIKKMKKGKIKFQDNYRLFLYFYCGFWLIALFYKSQIQSYYFMSFFPLVFLIVSSTYRLVGQKIFWLLIIFVFLTDFYAQIKIISTLSGGWKAYYNLANSVYQDAEKQEFGYYVFTPDQFGYSEKYAMIYAQKNFLDSAAFPFQKKSITYLISAPPPDDEPWLNSNWWKVKQVKIQRTADKTINLPNGFKVEKYFLTPEEIQIASDPNLIHDLTFR